MISGFSYYENAISASFSQKIDSFLKEHATQSRIKKVSDAKQSRKVIHYGYSYSYKKSGGALEKIEDIPDLLQELRQGIPLENRNDLNQCIINMYEPGQGIAPHIDDIYLFGDTIVSFTLFSSREISFTREKERIDILTNPNSVYILTGDARYSYKHEMRKRKKDKNIPRGRVVSITFREYTEK